MLKRILITKENMPRWNPYVKKNYLDHLMIKIGSKDTYMAPKLTYAIAHCDDEKLRKPLWNHCGKRNCLGDYNKAENYSPQLFQSPKMCPGSAIMEKLPPLKA